MNYLIFSNNYIHFLHGIVYFGSFLCRDAVSARSWVPPLAVVRVDVVKLFIINVGKKMELCFNSLIPLSELIFIFYNVHLFICHGLISSSLITIIYQVRPRKTLMTGIWP